MAESSKKVLSRRSLFTAAGGAAGLLIAKKVVSPAAPARAVALNESSASPVAPGVASPAGVTASSAEVAQVQQSSGWVVPASSVAPPEQDKRRVAADSAVPGPEADKRRHPAAAVAEAPALPQEDKRVVAENVVPTESVVALPTPEDDKRRNGSPNEKHGPAPRAFVAASTPVLDLLAPLKPGAQVYDWTVVAIHDVSMGAVPVILADKTGAKFQVDILRRDRKKGAPQSVADAAGLSLFLANEGNGQKASDESRGLGVVALATVLNRRTKTAPAGLLTWRERVSLFPKGEYKAPV